MGDAKREEGPIVASTAWGHMGRLHPRVACLSGWRWARWDDTWLGPEAKLD
jgi:hypothetical protein